MPHQLKYLFIVLITIFFLSSCNEDEFADWKILNENWLEEFKALHQDEPDFFKTESGIFYKVIHQSNYTQPNSNSVIYAQYTGKLINGTTFDSGIYNQYLSQAIRGWQEGIPKMRDGAHFIFYIPAELAYGEEGQGNVPPNSTLIFDIKLIKTYN
ncbi:MAG: FKBP-type peptidyl-prolyl cis-trans isomerase [Paludibacter sp.]|nr:FKBP-type peptidyl-prolyl cis-trans isomerase [Paludibacter sp.]